jgi:hypothetical protein
VEALLTSRLTFSPVGCPSAPFLDRRFYGTWETPPSCVLAMPCPAESNPVDLGERSRFLDPRGAAFALVSSRLRRRNQGQPVWHCSMASRLQEHTCVQGLATDCPRILWCQREMPSLLGQRGLLVSGSAGQANRLVECNLAVRVPTLGCLLVSVSRQGSQTVISGIYLHTYKDFITFTP